MKNKLIFLSLVALVAISGLVVFSMGADASSSKKSSPAPISLSCVNDHFQKWNNNLIYANDKYNNA